MTRAMVAKSPVNVEFRLRPSDGGYRWTNIRAAPVINDAGRIEKWVGMNVDIDERKLAEAAVRESFKRLS
jgi:PAS domain S-box-containing protein